MSNFVSGRPAMDIVAVLTKVAQEEQAKVAVLTKEAHDQQTTMADLQATMADQHATNAALQARLARLESWPARTTAGDSQ